MRERNGTDLFEGAITAAGFASGESVVVGSWARSPLGMFIDVMWRRPSGERVLLAPNHDVAAYVSGLYSFDTVTIVGVSGCLQDGWLTVSAGELSMTAEARPRDWRSWLFALRPRRLRRSSSWITLEDRLARPFVGRIIGGGESVRAAGLAPGGQQEFYGVDDWRALADASATVAGRDAGPMVDLPPDLGVGLSAFPTQPAMVHVGTLIRP